jgi:DNA-binding transcriptional LysR family regulator
MNEWRWDDVQLFLAIAETGSLSRAASRLKVGQPTVSRRLAELEYRLGYRLFNRRAQGVAPTAPAERLLEPAGKMAEWAQEVSRAAEQGGRSGPRGTVRLTAAPGLAFDFVAPFATVVQATYPELRLEVLTTVQLLDLTRGEADLALRLRPAVSSELASLGSLEVPTAVMVSRAYAATLPPKPALADLRWIAWAPPFEDIPPNPQLRALVPELRLALTSDNFLVQWRACEAGVGAMVLGALRHRFSLPTSLVALDVDLGPFSSSTLHLVCAKSALAVPRVHAVAQLLLGELRRVAPAPRRGSRGSRRPPP